MTREAGQDDPQLRELQKAGPLGGKQLRRTCIANLEAELRPFRVSKGRFLVLLGGGVLMFGGCEMTSPHLVWDFMSWELCKACTCGRR